MVGIFLVGFVWLNLQFSVSWLVDFQWGSCGSIFCFLSHGWQTFSGVRVVQSLVFCVMVGRFLVGFVWLNLQFSVSWLVDFQWGSCGSIFSFLCHGRQIFSGVRVAQSLVFCVMVGRLLVGFVWLNLQFCVMVGRFLGEFVWLNLQFSVSWQVDFQWDSCGSMFSLLSWQVNFQWGLCGSIFSFLCHGWQIFSGVRVAQTLVFCVMVGRLLLGFVSLNLQFCVMVGRRLVRFVWLNLQISVSCQVDFQWGSCVSIFSFLCHGRQTFNGVRVAQSLVLCHDWQTFSGVRVSQSLVFCVMIGRFQWGSCGSIFSFLCHDWQTFSGVRVAQSLVFCVMIGRFQWGSCGSIFSFMCHG